MIEVEAFNWTYWVKTIIASIRFTGMTLVIIGIAYFIKCKDPMPIKRVLILGVVLMAGYWAYSYVRFPYVIDEFEENKLVFSGRLCGFSGAREWYDLCIDGRLFSSDSTSRNMRNDAMFNFGWQEKPTGCVEIEYIDYGIRYTGGEKNQTRVAIGRLREIPCNQ